MPQTKRGRKPKEFVVVNMKLRLDIAEKLEKYRHRHMFATKVETIEFLLEQGMKLGLKPEAAE